MNIKGNPVKILLTMAVILILLSTSMCTITCAQDGSRQDREVVVVMDCSKSMDGIDSQYLVFDYVKGLAASLPMNCKMGLVAYNNGICASLPIGRGSAEIDKELSGIQYSQYGNAGAGMEAEVE